MRPQAIIWFERLYVAAFILGVISALQTWSLQAAMLGSDPRLATMTWLPYASFVIRIAIVAALWFFVARKGSVIAKWIVVVLAAYGAMLLLVLLYGLLKGSASFAIVVLSALQNIFYIAAAAMLFRPDALPWFGEGKPTETAA